MINNKELMARKEKMSLEVFDVENHKREIMDPTIDTDINLTKQGSQFNAPLSPSIRGPPSPTFRGSLSPLHRKKTLL